jgi:hypothetical protein
VGGWARDGLFQRNGKSWHLRTVLFKIKLKCRSSLFGEVPLIKPYSSPLCVISFVVPFSFPYPSPGARISMLVISARRDADKALCVQSRTCLCSVVFLTTAPTSSPSNHPQDHNRVDDLGPWVHLDQHLEPQAGQML